MYKINKEQGYIIWHRETQPLFYNNFKWNIFYKNTESRQSLTLFLSNHSPAGWLPQRRVARRRAGPPSTRWWQENTPSTFTSASMEWVSRSVPLGHLKKSGSLPWRKWELGTSDAHRHQAQQSRLGQRNQECPISDPCAVVQKTNEDED